MFTYQEKRVWEVKDIRPNFQLYLLLDRHLHGCEAGLTQATCYIRQAFMIHNRKFYDLYMELAMNLLSDMEIVSDVLHQLHGVDDRYYDESNDDTPAFEMISPCQKEESSKEDKHHVNNDLTACVLRDIAFEEKRSLLYERLLERNDDEAYQQLFQYLLKRANKAWKVLDNIRVILSTHQEVKDFGLGDSHNAFDLDTGNYFDKPNPYFINPSDVEKLD